MDAPLVRYARTGDGVHIAYWTLGDGPPLVLMTAHGGDIRAEWEIPEFRAAYTTLSKHFRVVGTDMRNYGLSDRGVANLTLEALMSDLAAVVEALGVPKVSIFAPYRSGPVALAYCAANPSRVSSLVLWCTWPSYSTVMGASAPRTFILASEGDWSAFGELATGALMQLSGDRLKQMAAYFSSSITQSDFQLMREASPYIDATHRLGDVECPTLVLDREGQNIVPAVAARDLVAAIPGATLRVVPGANLSAFLDEAGPVLDLIIAHVAAHQDNAPSPASDDSQREGAIRTILFTDLEGHTEMMSRLGDARGREVLREHERITRETLAAHSGNEVKTMGDGFMASFGSAQKALDCAIALQRALSAPLSRVAGEGLGVRVGINAGEPIAEDDDLFGASVIAAARIAAKAAGGQVLVSDVVRQLVAGKGFLFSDTGEHVLRGMEDPVRIWQLRWEGA